MQFAYKNSVALLMVALSLPLCGCVYDRTAATYDPGASLSLACDRESSAPTESPSALDLRFGCPNKIVDSTGWVFGIPRKVLLWDRRVDSHEVSDETTSTLAEFAEANNLDGLCVRVNQYDPLDEFSRLRTNQTVAPGWRYTLGTLSVVGYTVLPGRIFGGDQYNPYTNTVYVYSDVPALAVEATAYAKDVRSRSLPGTYAAVNELPLVSLWHETVNVRDAAAFVKANGTEQERIDGLRVLHANYGSTIAVATGAGPIVQVGAAVAGQFTGRFQASRQHGPANEAGNGAAEIASDESVVSDDQGVRLVSASETVD